MVRATWLQPQTRYSDTEAGASRIVLQASMQLLLPQDASIGMSSACFENARSDSVQCDQEACELDLCC